MTTTTNTMGAYNFGKKAIEEYIKDGKQVPNEMIKRMLEVMDELLADTNNNDAQQ